MTFRTRLLLAFSLTVVVAVGLVTGVVIAAGRSVFERLDADRTAVLVAQFRRDFARRATDVSLGVERIAKSDEVQRIAIELNKAEPDFAPFFETAGTLAAAQNLDFLEIVSGDATIVSSAQWPARFGYKEDWLLQPADWRSEQPFIRDEQLAEEQALALTAVRAVRAGEQILYVAGGERLDRGFISSIPTPSGIRILLAWPSGSVMDSAGKAQPTGNLGSLIERVRRSNRESAQTVSWSGGKDSAEVFHAIPLAGRNHQVAAVLLVGTSRGELLALENSVLWLGGVVAAGGILFGLGVAWWATSRVARPVRELATGARRVAGGDWDATVPVESTDEIGQLAQAFNTMTRELVSQRNRLIQAERVAAWRELARRLAHELKNPLFPLQITVENLQRARRLDPEQFDEVFRESTATLLSELGSLKQIIASFSDFAKMPHPELQPVEVNELVRAAVKLFEAQLHTSGRPPIEADLQLAGGLPQVDADPDQLSRVLHNLILNAMDAMPTGGTLAIRTAAQNGSVRIEVSDTGGGLSREERDRLFTPYYTTKQHGTGLGLAIVQSIISDHRGNISVESEPGRGTTFRLELPRHQSDGSSAHR
jgi:two-component system, NtrC family, nitrogen regulation sensor histidine kinase NtrY